MLIQENDFFNNFKKSFSNFCDNLPFLFSFYITGTTVILNDKSPLIFSSLTFQIDINKTVSDNIADIKNSLYQYFPVFYAYEEESIEDIQKKIEKGIITSFDYEPEYKKIKVYTLEKINNKKNQIIVFNEKEKRKEILTLKIPVITFLNNIVYEKEELKSSYIDSYVLHRKSIGG